MEETIPLSAKYAAVLDNVARLPPGTPFTLASSNGLSLFTAAGAPHFGQAILQTLGPF